jgi:hypothetical protein
MLVTFVVKNPIGKVLRHGSCDDSMVEKQPLDKDETIHVLGEGEVYEPAEAEISNIFAHSEPRRLSYPSVQDQLDAIWDTLSQEPEALSQKTRNMLERILAVKDQYPKDTLYRQRADGKFVQQDQ